MNKKQRKFVKTELVNLLTHLFGDKLGSTVDAFYDDHELELIMTTCGPLLVHVMGKENAKFHMQRIFEQVRFVENNPKLQ